jgi:4-hydroxy-tetrahydrodipicolinate synthase
MVRKNEAKDWARDKVKGIFHGTTTPFTADLGGIDEDALRRNLRHCVGLGAAGLGWGGPLAEPHSLTIEERKRGHQILAEEAQRAGVVSYAYPVSDTVPITLELARHAANVGCDLIMVNVPFEWSKTDEMIYEFFALVSAAAGDIGIMLYNTPHSGYILPLDLMDRICDLPNVCTHKGSGETLEQNLALKERVGDRIVVSGGTPLDWPDYAEAGFQFFPPSSAAYMLQGEGWQPLREMWQAAAAGRFEEARAICGRIEPLVMTWRRIYAALFGRPFGREEHPVAGIKAWADLTGMVGGSVRPPAAPFPPTEREWLERELAQHQAGGLLKRSSANRVTAAAG